MGNIRIIKCVLIHYQQKCTLSKQYKIGCEMFYKRGAEKDELGFKDEKYSVLFGEGVALRKDLKNDIAFYQI